LLLAAGALLVGCGISAEDAPRDINAPVRQESGENGRTAITATSTTLIYFVGHDDDGRFVLMPIARDATETITNALQALFNGPTTREANADLRTAIPSTTRLLKAVPNNDVVTIDVTADLAGLAGSALVDAIGQIVLTATNVTGVTGVVITIGDAVHPWPLPDGSTSVEPLSRHDYETLLPAKHEPVTEPTAVVTEPPSTPPPTSAPATTTTAPPPPTTVAPVTEPPPSADSEPPVEPGPVPTPV
jgi:hypothetical protein